jgi:hypothetical protein
VLKHQRVTGLKVALAAKMLQLSGKHKHAAALAHGLKTVNVMNTPRYVAASEEGHCVEACKTGLPKQTDHMRP